MTTNIEVNPQDSQSVVYNSKGVAHTVNDDSVYVFALNGDFCIISDAPPKQEPIEGEEHPPPGYAFAVAMVEFWTAMVKEIETGPKATPL